MRAVATIALLAVAASLGASLIVLDRSPYAARMTADLTLDRFSFRFEGDTPGRAFLQGVAVESCRVIDFVRITAQPERLFELAPGGPSQPKRWSPVAVPSPLLIRPAAESAPVEFSSVRLNQLLLEPKTLVTVTPDAESGVTLTLTERPSGAILTYESAVELECQHCLVGESAERQDVVWLRVESRHDRRVQIQGDRETLTLILQGLPTGSLVESLDLTNPVFHHEEPKRRVSYLSGPATVLLPELRVGRLDIPSGAALELAPPPGDRLRLTSFAVTPSGLQVTLDGRIGGLTVDGEPRRFTQGDRLSGLSMIVLWVLFGSSLSGAMLGLRQYRLRRRVLSGQAAGSLADEPQVHRDVFLSYARSDRDFAERMALALERNDLTVWWDRDIPHGAVFDDEIAKALDQTRCVIVLWSKASVASQWVRAEASRAAARQALVPVFIEDVASPLGFNLLQTADLVGSRDPATDPRFPAIVASVRRIAGHADRGDRSSEKPVATPREATCLGEDPE
jgi:hypothetical protein